jgi:RNA polymerase sigma-70 factor (ECF subfamily)
LTSVESTSTGLLESLQRGGDQAAWERFVRLYTPLLMAWARRAGLSDQDGADLTQEVLVLLLNKLPEFRYDQRGSFRAWLKTVATNKCNELHRRPAVATGKGGESSAGLTSVADPSQADAFWEQEYRERLVLQAMEIMRSNFEPTTWQACWDHIVSGLSAAEVGQRLGISAGAVYVAKSRVLRRLRQELAGLLD